MNKKITLGLALSLVAIASAVTFILTSFFTLQSFNKKIVDVNEKSKKYNALNTLDAYVRDNYYGDINENDLTNGILKGYVAGVGDNYSRYLTEDEFKDEVARDNGEQIGLGLTISEDPSGYIRIVSVLPDSPAEDEGIKPDDIIVRVEGLDVIEAGFQESANAMSGSEGASVNMTIRRNGVDRDYTFVRRSIEIKSVSGEMLNGYYGYIRITAFRKNTPEQFLEVLGRLTSNGAKALIFDLRDNGGGLTGALEECLDPLLPEGVMATAEYKDGHTETLIYSDESMIDLPIIILVNENTASSAEMFAACLRDFHGAKLIGVKTYGKAVMQQSAGFSNGGAIVLTVAVCKTAKSETYNGIGLIPDVIIENSTDSETDEQYNAAVAAAASAVAEAAA
ncbi:MAG: PDZ domain-containing protein [Ruminococcus sp.]|nr:PDZ domain-containing protein [Ruminococcus sp.]